jgi:fatty-acyl-CoA synthase
VSTTTDWNLAEVWEMCAEIRGSERTALVSGERRLSWADFDRRAGGVAGALLEAGLGHQSKVAEYLYNGNEYIESVYATLKAGMVPVNTNYRYGDEELCYLWDNADAEAIVFHGSFSDRVAGLIEHLPKVKLWLWVDDGQGPCPDFAVPYESAATSLAAGDDTKVQGPWGRSGDDLLFLYTGGTTGMPKGVMWRQDDLFCLLNGGSLVAMPDDAGLAGIRPMIEGMQATPLVLLPACPLMHGTGSFTAFTCLMLGGTVVTMPGHHFDPAALLDTIGREKVNLVTIVGDAFAKPMLRALDEEPGRFDLTSVMGFVSSGVMWSEETKAGLHRHNPNMLLIDAFSSSEALGMGSSASAAGSEAHTASFKIGPNAKVIDDEGREIEPGSGVAGRLAVGGRIPLGYYKDEAKTAATFVMIDGRRFSVPGDFAVVSEDGSLQLLGRGSVCINTGGEKVFPEEVEEVLKTHPAVADAACVGVPDDRFGEAITAVVEFRPGFSAAPVELTEHVREHLAHYKAPRHYIMVDSTNRSPSGKLDYKMIRSLAVERLAEVTAAAPS